MQNKTKVFYSIAFIDAFIEQCDYYALKETGLTLDNCYSKSDLELYAEVAAEIMPAELVKFIVNLVNNLRGVLEA